MAQQLIGVGTVANDGTGDKPRTAGIKINDNFTELYTAAFHFLGTYTTSGALTTAHPTASAGDYAYVDAGVGNPVEMWIWDDDDTGWVQSGSGGSVNSIVPGLGIAVDNTDPANPIVTNNGVNTITGPGVDNTDPLNPTMSFPEASEVVFAPSGGISSTDVNGALIELDAEKAPLASPTFTGTPTAPTAAPGTNTTQLATTAFVLANGGTPADASETVKGIIEIATQAEVNTGTDDVRAVTPLKLATNIANNVYADLDFVLMSTLRNSYNY